MDIIVGKNSGFCYGVKRAVENTENDLENACEKIYCLGEIVHNKEVVNELAKKGIQFIDSIFEADNTTIIRAHGVPKEVYKYAKENGIELRDYTCPNVLKIHKLVEKYADTGYTLVLFGSSEHPENIGTISFCGDSYFVIENEKELYEAIEAINGGNINKVLVVSQTTFSLEKFYIFEEILKNELFKNIDLVIENTICKATEIRQKETEELSKNVDCMIIIGGKNSSNTRKLYDIASRYCANSICIENEKEIDDFNFRNFDKIGIMAGASTPQNSIDDVKEKLLDIAMNIKSLEKSVK